MSLRSHTAKFTCSHLSQTFDNDTSSQTCVYMSIFFCKKPTRSKKNCDLCCVFERKLIAKVSVTNNLRQRKKFL